MRASELKGIVFKQIPLEDGEIPTASWFAKRLPSETKAVNISHVAFDTGRKVILSPWANFFERGKFSLSLTPASPWGALLFYRKRGKYRYLGLLHL